MYTEYVNGPVPTCTLGVDRRETARLADSAERFGGLMPIVT